MNRIVRIACDSGTALDCCKGRRLIEAYDEYDAEDGNIPDAVVDIMKKEYSDNIMNEIGSPSYILLLEQ